MFAAQTTLPPAQYQGVYNVNPDGVMMRSGRRTALHRNLTEGRSWLTQFRPAFVAILVAVGGCGGGGGTDNAATPGGSTSTPTALLPTQTSAPAPIYSSLVSAQAFTELNSVRLALGIGAVAQDPQLDTSSQAHATWMTTNNVFAHVETADTAGFYGTDPFSRAAAAGYQAGYISEVLAPVTSNAFATFGAAAVDALLRLPYHRELLLDPGTTAVGIGTANNPAIGYGVVNIDQADPSAYPNGQAMPESTGGAIVWPMPSATGVPFFLGGESPNPVPSVPEGQLGLPASVQCARPGTLTVSTFTIQVIGGQVVQTALLDAANDSNHVVGPCYAAAIPINLLAPSTTYQVNFVGTLNGASLTRSWVFTTEACTLGLPGC